MVGRIKHIWVNIMFWKHIWTKHILIMYGKYGFFKIKLLCFDGKGAEKKTPTHKKHGGLRNAGCSGREYWKAEILCRNNKKTFLF